MVERIIEDKVYNFDNIKLKSFCTNIINGVKLIVNWEKNPCSIFSDKSHFQDLCVCVLIFTRTKAIPQLING